MNKLSIKKLITVAVIAISAIACFALPNIISGINTKGQAGQVLDLGLQYKDGWYLINTSEDYYTMKYNIDNNLGYGAKYKLMNDITIGPDAGINSVRGISFDGNGHEIILDSEYEMKATDSILHPETPQEKVMQGFELVEGASCTTYSSITIIYGPNDIDVIEKVEEVPIYARSALSTNGGAWSQRKTHGGGGYYFADNPAEFAFCPSGLYALGGLYGYAIECSFSNINITFTDSLYLSTMKIGVNLAVGGLVGYAKNCTFENSLVKCESGARIFYSHGGEVDTSTRVAIGGAAGSYVGIANGCVFMSCLSVDAGDYYVGMIEYGGLESSYYTSYTCTAATVTSTATKVAPILGEDGFKDVRNGGTVATQAADILSGKGEWVLHPDINGGEIIQRCFVDYDNNGEDDGIDDSLQIIPVIPFDVVVNNIITDSSGVPAPYGDTGVISKEIEIYSDNTWSDVINQIKRSGLHEPEGYRVMGLDKGAPLPGLQPVINIQNSSVMKSYWSSNWEDYFNKTYSVDGKSVTYSINVIWSRDVNVVVLNMRNVARTHIYGAPVPNTPYPYNGIVKPSFTAEGGETTNNLALYGSNVPSTGTVAPEDIINGNNTKTYLLKYGDNIFNSLFAPASNDSECRGVEGIRQDGSYKFNSLASYDIYNHKPGGFITSGQWDGSNIFNQAYTTIGDKAYVFLYAYWSPVEYDIVFGCVQEGNISLFEDCSVTVSGHHILSDENFTKANEKAYEAGYEDLRWGRYYGASALNPGYSAIAGTFIYADEEDWNADAQRYQVCIATGAGIGGATLTLNINGGLWWKLNLYKPIAESVNGVISVVESADGNSLIISISNAESADIIPLPGADIARKTNNYLMGWGDVGVFGYNPRSGSAELDAVWYAEQFVYLDSNGGEFKVDEMIGAGTHVMNPWWAFDGSGNIEIYGAEGEKFRFPTYKLVAEESEIVREGWELVGWSTDSSAESCEYGNGTEYTFKQSDEPTSITLYAIWKPEEKWYSIITIDANGGKFVDYPTNAHYRLDPWDTSGKNEIQCSSNASGSQAYFKLKFGSGNVSDIDGASFTLPDSRYIMRDDDGDGIDDGIQLKGWSCSTGTTITEAYSRYFYDYNIEKYSGGVTFTAIWSDEDDGGDDGGGGGSEPHTVAVRLYVNSEIGYFACKGQKLNVGDIVRNGNVITGGSYEYWDIMVTEETQGSYVPINYYKITIYTDSDSTIYLPTRVATGQSPIHVVGKDGRILEEWYEDREVGILYGRYIQVTGDTLTYCPGNSTEFYVDIYAMMSDPSYTLKLYPNNGTPTGVAYQEGTYNEADGCWEVIRAAAGTVVLPTEQHVQREHYTFAGWAKDVTTSYESLDSLFNGEIAMFEGSLYAIWKPSTYTITLNGNGGTIQTGYPDENGKTEVVISYTIETSRHYFGIAQKSGREFLGWELAPESEGIDTIDFRINDNGYIRGFNVGSYGNATLIAVWEDIKYTIILDANGGEVDGQQQSIIEYTILDSITFSVPTKMGHLFNGWEFKEWNNGTGNIKFVYSADSYIIGIRVGSTGSATITASWTQQEYKVILNSNGGVWGSLYEPVSDDGEHAIDPWCSRETVENWGIYGVYGESFRFPGSSDISKPGSDFLGWDTDPDKTESPQYPISTSKYTFNGGTELTTTLYAVWCIKPYTIITIDANGGGFVNYPVREEGGSTYYDYSIEGDKNYITYSIDGSIVTLTVMLGSGAVKDFMGAKFNLPFTGEVVNGGKTLEGWLDPNNTIISLDYVNNKYFRSYTGAQYPGGAIFTAIWSVDDSDDDDEEDPGDDGGGGDPEGEYTLTMTVGAEGYWNDSSEDPVVWLFKAGDTINLPTGVTHNGNMVFSSWTVYNEDNTYSIVSTLIIEDAPEFNLFAYPIWEEPAPIYVNYYFNFNGGTPTELGYPGAINHDTATEDGYWQITVEEGTKVYLPTYENIAREGYRLASWHYLYDQATLMTQAPGALAVPDVTYFADWEEIIWTIILDAGSGTLEGEALIEYSSVRGITIDSYATLEAYTFNGWVFDKWDGEPGSINFVYSTYPYIIGIGVGSYGNATLIASWTENKYTIILDANGGEDAVKANTKNLGTFTYLQNAILDWTVTKENNVFIGWATSGYRTVQDYVNVYSNLSNGPIVGNATGEFGTTILINGSSVSQLSYGDATGSTTVTIYAIWLPIYSITINAGDGVVYNDGQPVAATSFTLQNHYKQGNLLYTQNIQEIFDTPTASGYRIHRYGYKIDGWIIKSNANGGSVEQYYTDKNDPNPIQWQTINDTTRLVASGTNMQYLQGDIDATPIWKGLKFDVIFKTSSNLGGYKTDTYVITEDVIIGAPYIITADPNISVDAGVQKIKAVSILGYIAIYAHPYNSDGSTVDTGMRIELQGVSWDYGVMRAYADAPTYGKTEGWFVEVEGYYAPDLYRIKVDLQLPYDATIDVDSKGFTSQTEDLSNLQVKYAPVVLATEGTDAGKYIASTGYTDRQNKIYNVDGVYYIYLLQDQRIEDGKKYDVYLDGKEYNDTTGVQLPTFSIPYYTMWYYYALSDTLNISLYQIEDLTSDQKEYAKAKLEAGYGVDDIDDATDWKYTYCSNSEDGLKELKIFWYRNVVNLQVENILNGTDTFSGYAIIEETEQLTGTLNEHAKYHLVIYTEEGATYGYSTFSFDDINKLRDGFDRFNSEDYADEIVEGNELPIFFGNRFTIYAVDQSKDHSMDEFIGHRFDSYGYDITGANCTTISEIDIFENDGINYDVTVNLQNYEHGIGNTTNYFNDKDILTIKVNFTKIQYVLNYQVTDQSNNVQSKYGDIRFEYNRDVKLGYQFEYTMTIDNENSAVSTMRVRLGSELYEWRLVNDVINSSVLTDMQTCYILLNAEFLRNNLYLHSYPSTARQQLGDINAVCGDIEFDIHVNVKNLKDGNIIREYKLSETRDNLLFTIENTRGINVATVSIDNDYLIKMLTKKAGDTFLHYYQQDGDGLKQYALRSLYIAYSLKHSTNQLVNTFEYPVESINDIPMTVNHALLDWCINYEQYIEVIPENRALEFYIEVSPMAKLDFDVETDENDNFKEDRSIYVGEHVVASAHNGEALNVVSSYWGFIGEQVSLRFVGSDLYYTQAVLSVDYTDEQLADNEMIVEVNSNTRYTIIGDATITIKLLPKTYEFTARIEYNGEEYSVTQYSEVINASGTNIFSLTNGVVIKTVLGNVAPATGIYYLGDKLHINYTLNESVGKDFEVFVYCNNIKLSYNKTAMAYVVTFNGSDIEVVISVQAKSKGVTLETNFSNKIVAEIYAQVNNGEKVKVENATSNYKQFNLINGDSINIYIKANIGYRFINKYTYSHEDYTVTCENDEDYLKFTLFETGFKLEDAGYYTLQFEQTPIDIQFKYYVVVPTIEECNDAKTVDYTYTYTNSDRSEIIKDGSTITLNKGNDAIGYRFNGYTYLSPQGVEGSKELVTTISDSQEQFVITTNILKDLVDVELTAENKVPLVIYVNYVRQYTFNISRNASTKVDVKDTSGNPLYAGVYYDYNTELVISAQTIDTEHYQISLTLNTGSEEIISNTNKESADIVSGSEIYTNWGNLAGFTIRRNLINTITMTPNAIVERYNIVLRQNLYHNVGASAETQTISLTEFGNGEFSLCDTILYEAYGNSYEHGSLVNIKILVLKPTDIEQQYYTISSARLNGNTLGIQDLGESQEGHCYKLTFNLRSKDLPIEMILDIDYYALHYVQVTSKVNG